MKKLYAILTALLLWPFLSYSQNADSCSVATAITDAGAYDVDTLTGGGGTGGYNAAD